jgi:transcriptional regulator with XRE-family HTH domain
MPLFNHYSDTRVNTKVIHASDLIRGMNASERGLKLREARNAKGLTQAQLASACGLVQSAIGNIESGTRGYGRSLFDIARVLEVDPAELLGEDPTPETIAQTAPDESYVDRIYQIIHAYRVADEDGRNLIEESAKAALAAALSKIAETAHK